MKIYSLPVVLLCSGVSVNLLQAQETIVDNGDFQIAGESADWPKGWQKLKAGGEWGKEGENRFLTLKTTTPGEMVMLYHEFKIPTGAKKLQLSWKQRVTGLKKGAQPWFDARILLEFANAERAKLPGKPKAPNSGKDTGGWEEKSITIDVPEGAVFLQFMPCLFQAEAGTFDLDDVVLKVTDVEPAVP